MSKPEIKSKLFNRLDDDLKELVEKALYLDGAGYLKVFMLAGINQELREIHRTNADVSHI